MLSASVSSTGQALSVNGGSRRGDLHGSWGSMQFVRGTATTGPELEIRSTVVYPLL